MRLVMEYRPYSQKKKTIEYSAIAKYVGLIEIYWHALHRCLDEICQNTTTWHFSHQVSEKYNEDSDVNVMVSI